MLRKALIAAAIAMVASVPVAFNGSGPQAAGTTILARAWRGMDSDGALPTFPELELPELQKKRNTAVAFSGGGLRAYTATFGALRSLLDLELLQHTRYITGVSGGAWATAVYTYYNPLAGPQVGLYPIVTLQYSSTALYQVSYHTR